MSDATGINGSPMNKTTFKSICLVWLTCLLFGRAQVHAQTPFRLERNEVVAFLGGANMVYLQKAGYLESILSGHFVQSSPQFRDLAWEADTVFRQGTVIERWRKRAHFDQDGGLGDLNNQLKRIGASMIISQFGQSESLEGLEPLAAFSEAYSRLIESWLKDGRRVVLLTPTPFENSDNPHLPNLAQQNEILSQYVNVIRQLAKKHRVFLVDLFHQAPGNATSNGRHISPEAHPIIATQIANQLGIDSHSHDALHPLRRAVIEKHRLWLNYWRPTNWKLLFGDDARRQFTKGPISLREEWLTLPRMIAEAEERIQRIAIHGTDPGPNRPPKEILHGDPQANIEKELAAFTLPEGFSVNLFASEHQGLTSPLNVRWDPSGRMYVTTTTTYPHVFPGDLPNDKIIVLEDKDRNGVADSSTVFADGLNIPTGIEWGHGGIYVGQNTEILFLKDTDGDGQADQRRVLLSGFGDGDSHQTINSFIWSPDGQLYFGHGDGCESRVETPWGTSALFNAGYFKLRPLRLQLVPFLEAHMGPGNPWGIDFDPWGQSFGVDGAGGVSWLAPAQVPTTHRRKFPRIGNPGGYCGIGYLGSESLPAHMRGTFAIGDYKANRVSRFSISDHGSGFALTWEEPLLSSSHRNFRPVDIKEGPDGAVYVVDWYNPITCHQDDAFRDPTRDKAHGRIWRISIADHRKQKKSGRPVDLLKAPISETIQGLKAPDSWTRYQAKRALTGHPVSEVASALDAWVRTLDHKNPDHASLLYEALMSFASIETVRPNLLRQLLRSSDMRIRAAATKLIGRWHDRIDAPLELLSESIHDIEGRVRLEAIVACSAILSPRSMQVAVEATDHPVDQWIDYALKQTIHRLLPIWLPVFKQGESQFTKPAHLAFILNEIKDRDAVNSLRSMVDAGALNKAANRNAIISILANGDPEDFYQYGIHPDRHMRNKKYDSVSHAVILEALAQILETNPAALPEKNLQLLKDLALHTDKRIGIPALKLIGLAGFKDASGIVVEIATREDYDPELRVAALRAMGDLDTAGNRNKLIDFARKDAKPMLRSQAIMSLAQFDLPSAAEAAVDYLVKETISESYASNVLASLTHKGGGSHALAEALQKNPISAAVAKHLQRILYASGNPDPELLAALNQASIESDKERAYDASFIQNLAGKARREGNTQIGQRLFSQLACNACHQVSGVGGLIGPELTTIGSTLSPERIIEELLWPDRQIKEGYTPVEVNTKDDRIFIGYDRTALQRPEQGILVLQDTVSPKLIQINQEEIRTSKKLRSLMPQGLTDDLSEKELAHLVHYLTQLGTQ
ncbi:MAG: c-type cytochrome [Verrucomicrobia bacterium]|nr:c-type cytochrome [Verrucomicrobiota bacterium]